MKLINASCSRWLIDNQIGLLEQTQILRNRRTANRKVPGKLADSQWAVEQASQNSPAGGIAKRIKLDFLVSVHLR